MGFRNSMLSNDWPSSCICISLTDTPHTLHCNIYSTCRYAIAALKDTDEHTHALLSTVSKICSGFTNDYRWIHLGLSDPTKTCTHKNTWDLPVKVKLLSWVAQGATSKVTGLVSEYDTFKCTCCLHSVMTIKLSGVELPLIAPPKRKLYYPNQ